MRTLCLFCLSLYGFSLMTYSQPLELENLESFRWEKRLVLVFARSDQDPAYQALAQNLENTRDELLDRDIRVFHLFEQGKSYLDRQVLSPTSAQRLQRAFRVQPGQLTLILIGKDGGEKQRQTEDISVNSIFPLIDGMPMRQAEMRRKKQP